MVLPPHQSHLSLTQKQHRKMKLFLMEAGWLFGIESVIQMDYSSTWKIIANSDLSWYHQGVLAAFMENVSSAVKVYDVQEERTNKEDRALACSPAPLTAERRRSLWYMTHYPMERKGLLVTLNGNPVDYHTIHRSLLLENGPTKADLYSMPQYHWERTATSPEKEEEKDDEKEFEDERSREKRSVKVHAMVSMFQFIIKQSYICTLIATMTTSNSAEWGLYHVLTAPLSRPSPLEAWSITYHSWMTFMLLIWSCTLWIIHNRKKYAMISSPFMVVYGNLLPILRYIWSFELSEIKKVLEILRKEGAGGACLKYDEQDVEVDSKAQEKEEEKEPREEQQEQREEEEEEEVDEQDVMKVLGNLVVALFIKYLIYICRGMFFFISFEGKIMMYKIFYMVLFLFYVALYPVSLFNYVFLISWAFTLPYAELHCLSSSVCTVWTCAIIVCKMLHQLQTIKPENFSVNCSLPNEKQMKILLQQLNMSLIYSAPIDPMEWMGLRKSSPLLVYLRNNLLMLAILAFEVTIYRHQEYYQANVIGQRIDFYIVIHTSWLIAVLYRHRRKAITEILIHPSTAASWLASSPSSISSASASPPAPCRDYPWRFKGASFNDNIVKWLYFPDFIVWPKLLFLLCKSYLDISMVVIFSYLFWFVLTIIFITGTTRISNFCMGYVVACFYFLLFGGNLLLKPIKSILCYWD
ncbi:unnamed protein product [Rangifer tarandus platyrhynchus]|uniref:Uncharacterized protein n=1 Tax=Rangifer tarandus platyrhynchus TaxID=3082113 RepID=A0ABN9A4U1_RANTA|nr:unnamed protein product [Rangifer tarandus platyrhynchus]